jgi:hypothetical protein
MKTYLVMMVSVLGLCLGGCADQPLVADEDYNATHGPAPQAPDPMGHIPQPSTLPAGY